MYCHEFSSENILSPWESKSKVGIVKWGIYAIARPGLVVVFEDRAISVNTLGGWEFKRGTMWKLWEG